MEDDKLIPLSYISQYYYCKRRAGLLMLERQWEESVDTVKGTAEHRHVHTAESVTRGKSVVLTDLCVVSQKMRLFGRCDAVEARKDNNGTLFPFLPENQYILYPVEYKHGKLRSEREYELQLCAQAMCLEEMYDCNVPEGAIFFISSHRRKDVRLDDARRNEVRSTAEKLASMLEAEVVPPPIYSSKCTRCSLKEICQPQIADSSKDYLKQMYSEWGK